MQATLSTFTSSRASLPFWIHRIRSMPPLPHARRDPIVEPGQYARDGCEEILAFFYCTATRDIAKFEPCPEIVALARDLISDGWTIEACDCLGGARRGGPADYRLIVYRWIDGLDPNRSLYLTDSLMGGEAVPVCCGVPA